MSAQFDALRREVEESRSVTESAVSLIGGLATQIRDLKDDPAALEALTQQLSSQSDALAAAIQSNSPAPADSVDAGGGDTVSGGEDTVDAGDDSA